MDITITYLSLASIIITLAMAGYTIGKES